MQQTRGRRGDAAARTSDSRGDAGEISAILLLALAALAARSARGRAGRRDREGDREIPRDAARRTPGAIRAILDVDRGEALWTTAAGPKKATLEQCDLGKGPGKVEGAFAELPRYFADADRVMDVETRILWCMEKLQGISAADYVKRPHPGGGQPVKELGAMATYVASKSAGEKFAAPLDASRRSARRPRSARRCSTAAPARSISPARPAMPIPACASACRACPISPRRRKPPR